MHDNTVGDGQWFFRSFFSLLVPPYICWFMIHCAFKNGVSDPTLIKTQVLPRNQAFATRREKNEGWEMVCTWVQIIFVPRAETCFERGKNSCTFSDDQAFFEEGGAPGTVQ